MTHPQPPLPGPFDIGPVGYTGDGVAERAHEQGVSDARGGILDTWSFDPGAPPPHLSVLQAEEGRVLARLPADDRTRMEVLRGRIAEGEAARATTVALVADLEAKHGRAVHEADDVRARIDALARDDERRRRRGLLREGDSHEDLPGGVDAAGPETARWEGPYTAPPLPSRLKQVLLIVLVAIDVPIQWAVFDYFHGDTLIEQVLSGVFAVSVASIMVLLPHLAGYLYRGRHTTGEERKVILTGLVLLLPGLYLAAVLGYLRARVLLVPPTVVNESGAVVEEGLKSAAEPLHASDLSIIALFVMLLFITSGISFLLGTARFHPLRTAYEGAADARDLLADRLADARGRLDSICARHAELRAACDRLEASAQQRMTADQNVVRQTFRTARIRYLDGVATGLADAKATEAIAELIRTL
ncbi:hypothetical protein FXF51_16110 [Nonomuraea sp. PA05]|uniref:hypothetical protein n=1 Tax=Nonomuraea sp. PA05 TaxID=2604466 RepID=UPI0011D3805A|nr:hypothetical protein [Nonomuraea sp. PA05]TYB66633.1 hypothetical protein FXF51_16110 [Nonomuraea sp. PA05]